MFSFLFFDPHRRHYPSAIDSDILFLRCLHCLYDCVSMDNHIQQITCICCSDATVVIDEVQRRRPGILIYLCTDHSEPGIDPGYGPNVRDDIVFTFDNQWEVKGRLALMATLARNQHRAQIFDEIQKIRRIKNRSENSSQTSINVVNQQVNITTEYSESQQTK